MALFCGMLVNQTKGILPVNTPVPPRTTKSLVPSTSHLNPTLGDNNILLDGQRPVENCFKFPFTSGKLNADICGFSNGCSK